MILQNSSLRGRVPGVCFNPRTERWRSHITIGKNQIYLGVYKEKKDAVLARKRAEEMLKFYQK